MSGSRTRLYDKLTDRAVLKNSSTLEICRAVIPGQGISNQHGVRAPQVWVAVHVVDRGSNIDTWHKSALVTNNFLSFVT